MITTDLPQQHLQIPENLAGERIDKALHQLFPEQSRTYFQKLLEEGLVLLNNKQVKKRELLKAHQELKVTFALNQEINIEPQDIPLDILYEDEHLLAINKPAGMVVHPAPGNWENTFVNALLFHLNKQTSEHNLRPGIVHRLDKETSGVLLAAKDEQTAKLLVEQFAQRKIKKIYLAICLGNPGVSLIDKPIARHPVKRKEMTICQSGKPAITLCKTLDFDDKKSVVQLEPKTGRTHQIRVHLRHLNCPILGDKLYGPHKQTQKVDRQMLHAYAISFEHPITKKTLSLCAPIPEDFYHEALQVKAQWQAPKV